MKNIDVKVARKAKVARDAKYRTETAACLRDIASFLERMAEALEKDDNILGVLATTGLANNLPALPKNVRDALAENLTDEAAAGYRSDLLYAQSIGSLRDPL